MPNTVTTNEATRSPIDGTEFVRLATTGAPGNNFKAQLKAIYDSLGTIACGHRLTLTSATPVLTNNTTAQSTVYLTPYIHNRVAIYDGATWVTYKMPEDSITLDATNFTTSHLYDVFVALNSGTPNIGYGPAWSTGTSSRGSGAGTTQLVRQDGIWTNANTITLRRSSGSTFSVAVNKATYVGTLASTANGQTGMQFGSFALGGGANVLGVYNAFNKVFTTAYCEDSTISWTYNTQAWRSTNNSANNSISWVDGLGDVFAFSTTSCLIQIVDAGNAGLIGIAYPVAGAPQFSSQWQGGIGAGQIGTSSVTTTGSLVPQLGQNAVYSMELAFAPAGVITYYGAGLQQLTLSVFM